VGWIVAPAGLTDAIRKVHDFLTVGAPAPLQEGVAAALETLDRSFYDQLAVSYRGKRDLLHSALVAAGFRCESPQGAYYILADFTGLGPASAADPLDDTAFAVWLSREVGVTPVPGSSFYREGGGRSLVRFVFCKTDDILAEAARRLGTIGGGTGRSPRVAERAVESGLQR
jgi:aminotransferase